jgi:acyl dehydratase
MPKPIEGIQPLRAVFDSIGLELGPTDWLTVEAHHLRSFAEAACLTGEDGVDLTISKNNNLGPELVDGFLVLSLLIRFHWEIWPFRNDGTWALNYGTEHVRFVSPLYVGERIRMTIRIEDVTDRGDGRVLVRTKNTIEAEGRDRPIMVGDWLALYLGAEDRAGE